MTKTVPTARPKSMASSRPRGRPVKGSEMTVVQDIVAAAQALFFQNGYERTSTDQVAALAKCSKRTVYAKFATKAELFDAVVRRFVGEKQALADPYVLAGTTLRERLMNMAETSVEGFLQEDVRALYFLVHREADTFPELVRIVEESGRRPVQRRIMDLLDEGGIEGDHEFLADQFSSLLYWPLTRLVIAGETDVTEDVLTCARASVDFFLRGCGYFGHENPRPAKAGELKSSRPLD